MWKHVEVKDISECWEYKGLLDKHGYGRVSVGKKKVFAHRISYQEFNGNLEKGKVVMHKCDNPCCVNPHHLILGTQAENMLDKKDKGRQVKGTDINSSKLSEKDVSEILSDTRSCRKIAKDYHISHQMVSKIKRGMNWSWLS